MGQIIGAFCPCGYKEPALYIGGGMMNFKTHHGFPAYCPAGKPHLVMVNLLEEPLKCPQHKKTPIPYSDKSLVGKLGRKSLLMSRVLAPSNNTRVLEFELTNGTYLCPKCQNFTLKFRDLNICFD
ncbi:MAG: hypothetical protein PHD65_01095 [Gallionella sp.]|nr:hypothetical protein [Gallionella sp.]